MAWIPCVRSRWSYWIVADLAFRRQDEKPEVKAEDAEMKTDEDDAAKPDEATTATTPAKPKRKVEPTSDRLSNLSRVTPAQLSYITFPTDARYVPVRPIFSSHSRASTAANPAVSATPRIGAGGGILMMRDREPEKEAEFLEMEVMKVVDTEAAPVVGAGAGAGAGEIGRAHV